MVLPGGLRVRYICTHKYFSMRLKVSVAVLLLVTMSCSSSETITSWKAENVGQKKYNKIVVLGVIGGADLNKREEVENHFVGDLCDVGYDAVTSISVLGSNAFKKLSVDSVFHYIKATGADVILTVVLLDKIKEQRYMSDWMRNGPVQGPFESYYSMMYDRVNNTRDLVTDSRYFCETNLYDLANNKILYSVQTQSFSFSTIEAIDPHQYSRMVVIDMLQKKVL